MGFAAMHGPADGHATRSTAAEWLWAGGLVAVLVTVASGIFLLTAGL